MPPVAGIDWDNLRCLYAEDLKNKRVQMTVGGVRTTPKAARLFCRNEYTEAWDVAFMERDAEGRTPYIQIPRPNAYGKKTGLLRTYSAAMGGEPCAAQVGRKLTLTPVKSAKSETGQAIRVAVPEHMA